MTHRDACMRRLAHVPGSDCPGQLVPRRLRRFDSALRCVRCGAVLRRDGAGVVTTVAVRGEVVASAVPDSPGDFTR